MSLNHALDVNRSSSDCESAAYDESSFMSSDVDCEIWEAAEVACETVTTVPSTEVPTRMLIASADNHWPQRRSGHSYTSMGGVTFASSSQRKVATLVVKSKHFSTCEAAKRSNVKTRPHYSANHLGANRRAASFEGDGTGWDC